MTNERKCEGNCPNTCKAHMGDYQFCTNEGCICHDTTKSVEESWEVDFERLVEQGYFDNRYTNKANYSRIKIWAGKLLSSRSQDKTGELIERLGDGFVRLERTPEHGPINTWRVIYRKGYARHVVGSTPTEALENLLAEIEK